MAGRSGLLSGHRGARVVVVAAALVAACSGSGTPSGRATEPTDGPARDQRPASDTAATAPPPTADLDDVAFTRVDLPISTGYYTGVAIGPDGRLYAGTIDGVIERFVIAPDGTLATKETITTLTAFAGPRLLIGLVFDPASTATDLRLYVSHSEPGVRGVGPIGQFHFGGRVSLLTGDDLGKVHDIVTNLPRSHNDHLPNGLAFRGADGRYLYLSQGASTAVGAPDEFWGLRPETPLTAAVLRIDLQALAAQVAGTAPALDLTTAEGGGQYDPFAPDAPVTVYASGVRNAYDLVWHSNGQLYVPTNGSGPGGNTPALAPRQPCSIRLDGRQIDGPVEGLTGVAEPQRDYLFRVEAGGYYGHPNPSRCEFVLNGGNPTEAQDPAEVVQYSVPTPPDPNWRGSAFDFGINKSPNGVVEYRSDTFDGALQGRLLVVRYSQGDDIMVLTPGGSRSDIVAARLDIPGFTNLREPLDLTENVANGDLYLIEAPPDGDGRIVLLRPAED